MNPQALATALQSKPQEPDMTPTILVVDDDCSIREMLCELLQGEGYRVVTAANGLEAVDLLQQGRPDLVISDVMMPILDGGHLASLIHALSPADEVPVIGVTALSNLSREADAHFTEVLHKPFDVEQLLRVVEGLLDGRKDPRPLP